MSSPAGSRSALLVMDIQPLIVSGFGGDDALIDRIQQAIAAARAAQIPVVYGKVAFRPGYPEVSESNALFAPLREMMDLTEANPDADVHSAVAPQDGDVVITKRRVSTFTGSDLDVVLRSMRIDRIVLTGVATSGVVLSTLRQAADLDYEIAVLADGCADGDPEVHRVLTEKVFPMQATVTTVEEWARDLKAASA